MAKEVKSKNRRIVAALTATKSQRGIPRSLAIAERGITTAHDFASMMSALMSDVIDGRVPPDIANASVSAGRNLLKVVEMQHKYGHGAAGTSAMVLAPNFTLGTGQ